MDRLDIRKHVRRVLGQFKSKGDVSYLLEELYQRDPRVQEALLHSLESRVGNAKRSLKAFLITLEDKILEDYGSSGRWISVIAFIDVIAFRLYKIHRAKWNSYEILGGPRRLSSPLSEEDLISLRSAFKHSLPTKCINSVQQLIIKLKPKNNTRKHKKRKLMDHNHESLLDHDEVEIGGSNNREEEEEGSSSALPLLSIFRISSFSLTKALKQDPIKQQLMSMKTKPLFIAFFNGTPHIFSPVTLRNKAHINGILGAFEASQINKLSLTSNDLSSLYKIVRNPENEENVEPQTLNEQQQQLLPTSRIILNDIFIESESTFNETCPDSAYQGKMACVLRIQGDDIQGGIEGLRSQGIIDNTLDSEAKKWMEYLPSVKTNHLLLENGLLHRNEEPLYDVGEWNDNLRQRQGRKKLGSRY